MAVDTLRRRAFLREVLKVARDTGDTVSPWSHVEAAASDFASADEIVAELHHEWVRTLVSRLHRGRIVANRTAANVSDIYREVAESTPTLRAVLDTHAGNPVLLEHEEREFAMLAQIAGLSDNDSPRHDAARIGRSLVRAHFPAQRAATA